MKKKMQESIVLTANYYNNIKDTDAKISALNRLLGKIMMYQSVTGDIVKWKWLSEEIIESLEFNDGEIIRC